LPEQILVVDDDPSVQAALSKALVKRGFHVESVASAEAALGRLSRGPLDLVLLDVGLPGMSGLSALPLLREAHPDLVIIVITGQDSRDVAVEAIRKGAYDFFTKPFRLVELEIVVQRALEKRRLLSETRALRERLIGAAAGRMIGQSAAMKALERLIERVAPLDSTVLITGESGTGKELVADLIHYRSPRAGGPLVKINCAAIPEGLLESELFGHEKGAFTGAQAQKPGKFESAHRGTILLDEVGEMPVHVQAKLLRVVEHKQVERLGGKRPVDVDVRIMASTNQDLQARVAQGAFRGDLFYRLNVAAVHLPPLRERKEDIPLLVQHFLQEINGKLGTRLRGLSQEALERLLAHPWPGNVRELSNVLERGAILAAGEVLEAFHLSPSLGGAAPPAPGSPDPRQIPLRRILDEVERNLIVDALERCRGVQTEAARILGVTPKNLWKKIQRLAVEVRRPADP
jgi:two-component system response regulator AtoC